MAIAIKLTDAGLAAVVNAENTGTAPVTITEFAVGTGEYVPDGSETALVNEVNRVSTVGGSVVSPNIISVTARDETNVAYSAFEFGLFLDDGTLFAVASQIGTPFFVKAAEGTFLLTADIAVDEFDTASVTFGDLVFSNPPASETVAGVARIATNVEILAGVDNATIVSPLRLSQQIIEGISAFEGTLGALAFLTTINNSLWSGEDLAVENGGTGASTPEGARDNLALGVNSVPTFGSLSLQSNFPFIDFIEAGNTDIWRVVLDDNNFSIRINNIFPGPLNLNADGASITGNLTTSGAITSNSTLNITSATPTIILTATNTGAVGAINATSSAGSLFIDVDQNSITAGALFGVNVRGTRRLDLGDFGAVITGSLALNGTLLNCNLVSTSGIFEVFINGTNRFDVDTLGTVTFGRHTVTGDTFLQGILDVVVGGVNRFDVDALGTVTVGRHLVNGDLTTTTATINGLTTVANNIAGNSTALGYTIGANPNTSILDGGAITLLGSTNAGGPLLILGAAGEKLRLAPTLATFATAVDFNGAIRHQINGLDRALANTGNFYTWEFLTNGDPNRSVAFGYSGSDRHLFINRFDPANGNSLGNLVFFKQNGRTEFQSTVVTNDGVALGVGLGVDAPQRRFHARENGATIARFESLVSTASLELIDVNTTATRRLTFSRVGDNTLIFGGNIGDNPLIELLNSSNGGNPPERHVAIVGGLTVQSDPTATSSGFIGEGNINCEQVFQNGNGVLCYVFDAALDGEIDLQVWDKRQPGMAEHMRRFNARLGTDHDPLDIDKYGAHWMEKRHLTALPSKEKYSQDNPKSLGSWAMCLAETAEIQAVHIQTLNQRTRRLDERVRAIEERANDNRRSKPTSDAA